MRRLIRTASTYVKDLDPKCACRNYADFFLELHRFGSCSAEPTVGQFMCAKCFKGTLRTIHDILTNGSGRCPTCGAMVVTPADMIVRIVPIG
jgi:hypothetical protein